MNIKLHRALVKLSAWVSAIFPEDPVVTAQDVLDINQRFYMAHEADKDCVNPFPPSHYLRHRIWEDAKAIMVEIPAAPKFDHENPYGVGEDNA